MGEKESRKEINQSYLALSFVLASVATKTSYPVDIFKNFVKAKVRLTD